MTNTPRRRRVYPRRTRRPPQDHRRAPGSMGSAARHQRRRTRRLHPARIVHLCATSDLDGKGLHILDLAECQLQSGAAQPIVATGPTPAFRRHARSRAVPIVELPDATIAALLAYARRMPAGVPGPELIHAHGYRAAYALAILRRVQPGRCTQVPIVFTCHGWMDYSVRRRVRKGLQRRCYRFLPALIACSPYQLTLLRDRCPGIASTCVMNGIDVRGATAAAGAARTESASECLPEHRPLVGAIGRLAVEKRHDVFIRACARIRDARPDVRFVLVGSGPERATLGRLV